MAFQSNAFQNDAFQVSGGAGAGAGLTFPLVIGFVLDGASPSPDTAALTGSVVTVQTGTLGVVNETRPPQGAVPQPGPGVGPFSNNQFQAGPRGFLTVSTGSAALTGEQVAANTGTLTPNIAAALAGSAVTATAGNVTPSLAAALSGSQVSASAGTLSAALAAALTGSQVSVQTGTLTPVNSSAATAALTGSQVSVQTGFLTPVNGSQGATPGWFTPAEAARIRAAIKAKREREKAAAEAAAAELAPTLNESPVQIVTDVVRRQYTALAEMNARERERALRAALADARLAYRKEYEKALREEFERMEEEDVLALVVARFLH